MKTCETMAVYAGTENSGSMRELTQDKKVILRFRFQEEEETS